MTESTPVSLNLQSPNISTVVYAVQNDRSARHIVAQLRDGSAPWTPPAGAAPVIRYVKPDGTGGFYDADDNDDPAIVISGSKADMTIVEQALTVPGDVYMQLHFYAADGTRLTSFAWILRVQQSVLNDATIVSSDYFNVLTAKVSQAVQAAAAAAESAAEAAASAALISIPLPITSGGTGATTAAGARENIGLGNVANERQYSADNPPPYPVTKVNNKTGDVTLGKSDVGLSNVDNIRQYSANNQPPYPVRSVNGQTGDVNVVPATDAQVSSAVNTWLGNNVDPATGYVLDNTLTMGNAAPPASAVGVLKSTLLTLTETGSVTGTGAGDYFINFPVKAGDKIKAITTIGVNIYTRATQSGANIEELGYVNGTRVFTATADAEWFKLYFTGAGTASFTNLSKRVPVLEVDAAYLSKNVDALETAFNEAITSNLNRLEFAEKTTNTIWSRNSGTQSSNLYGDSFAAIPIKSGTTYYFRNIYAYFSLIKKLDGTFTPLTDDTSASYSGTYTADDDGYACITISNDPNYSRDYLFTDSQKMYNDANPRTYFVPNKLQVGNKVFTVGPTREYTRLRDGIAEAIKYKNSTVFVDAGTYDLCTEFASEITANQAGVKFGIGLGNGVRVIFEAGAKVVANYTGGVQNITSYFNPFYPVGDGNFTLENADIDVKNTRYCVHDEWSGKTKARIVKYINCKMVMDNTSAVINWYPQCIGGGNGASDYISIENCYFKSKVAETAPAPLVSYHNNNSGTGDMKSDVHVSNCYFANKGTFRCTYSGQATAVSSAYMNNCSLGSNPIIGQEQSGGTAPENYELITWLNEVRSN